MTCYSRTPLYVFIVLGKSSRLQEPNAEADHPECSTRPGTHPPQAQQIYSRTGVSLYQARRQLIWRGHALLHQASKNNQMGRCVEHTKGRHMCPALAMEAYRECCHYLSLLIPLRNEHKRRTKMRTCSEQLFTCIFQYVIGYGGRNSLIIDQFVHVHNDPFYSLCFCLELVHGMQSIMRQHKAMPVILPICTYTCTALSGKDHTHVCVWVCCVWVVCVCVTNSVCRVCE